MLPVYQYIMRRNEERLKALLQKRLAGGKEHPERFKEKQGVSSLNCPEGSLIWLHAASVGEAQSALILIRYLLEHYPDIYILVTTGTLTSASMMEKTLPDRAFHQFFPLDHPDWCAAFLDHWHPDLVLWMESELWPNMLLGIQEREIPAVLVNARLSLRSMMAWRLFRGSSRRVLSVFDLVLCQTRRDTENFEKLGAKRCITTDNLKYSARPLPYDSKELQLLQAAVQGRPVWFYASTHQGEEELACRAHQIIKAEFPNLLTIIAPRHPERRANIAKDCEEFGLNMLFRGEGKMRPAPDTDIYVVDTMGELGLFYRLAAIACIGRSFSEDGGGGHNPIEAAQLNCAVLHGPNVQNLQDIFDEMDAESAALLVKNEERFIRIVRELLETPERLQELQRIALAYSKRKSGVLERVVKALAPAFDKVGL